MADMALELIRELPKIPDLVTFDQKNLKDSLFQWLKEVDQKFGDVVSILHKEHYTGEFEYNLEYHEDCTGFYREVDDAELSADKVYEALGLNSYLVIPMIALYWELARPSLTASGHIRGLPHIRIVDE